MLSRYESTLSTGMSTSSCFVSVFTVSLRLIGLSANVAVCLSVDDFVVSFTQVLSCDSVRLSPLLELEAPGVIVVTDDSPCISWSSTPASFTEGS